MAKRRYTTKNKTARPYRHAGKPLVWDQLNTLKESSRQLMMQASGIKPLLQDKGLQDHLEDPQATARLVFSVARDSKQYIEEFKEIAKSHEDKKGVAKNEQEAMESLNISMQYFDLTEGFKSNVLTNVADISDHYLVAANKRKEMEDNKVATQEPNPNNPVENQDE